VVQATVQRQDMAVLLLSLVVLEQKQLVDHFR
jgi:hypothetical protein